MPNYMSCYPIKNQTHFPQHIIQLTFFRGKKSKQKCLCPNYSLQASLPFCPIYGKTGSGSQMSSHFPRSATETEGFYFYIRNGRTGDNFTSELEFICRVIGIYLRGQKFHKQTKSFSRKVNKTLLYGNNDYEFQLRSNNYRKRRKPASHLIFTFVENQKVCVPLLKLLGKTEHY